MLKILGLRLGSKAKVFDTSKEEYLELLKNKKILLIDVRSKEEQEERKPLRHDAIRIDYNGHNFEEEIQQLDKNREYLVNCSGGIRSRGACLLMKKNGFTNLRSLQGGLNSLKNIKS